jgi:hypothetical protein
MLKRFMIGFVVGIGAMYWYIHHAADDGRRRPVDEAIRVSVSRRSSSQAVEQEAGGTNR